MNRESMIAIESLLLVIVSLRKARDSARPEWPMIAEGDQRGKSLECGRALLAGDSG
jgi:hypothetical protein